MKNIYVYYLTMLLPFGIILWLIINHMINSTVSLSLLIFYLLIYRTYIDGKRLVDKNIIDKKNIWKMIIPGKRFEYFRELYLK